MRAPGTSESSPLRIVAVTPGEGHGRIGITLCPGKTDPAGMTGLWARDLDAALDAIQRWGATAVVSLISSASEVTWRSRGRGAWRAPGTALRGSSRARSRPSSRYRAAERRRRAR